ncbi:hypothetical protein KKG72_10200 [bacterium]|nr:hypothetical protein [bacterium]MBU1995214.1 hypothetical protein [bacterium]
MNVIKSVVFGFIFLMSMTGCVAIVKVDTPLPGVSIDKRETNERKSVLISLLALNNYTDTPQAGMRASSIIEGVLLAKGYRVITHISAENYNISKALEIAKKDGSDYFMYGGVSEWRYKTGIDGEPAVSIQCTLAETNSSKVVWNATGADSDWGNASIGTTAQNLIESMLSN